MKRQENSVSLRRQIWKYRSAYVMIAPFMLIFFTFTVYPVLLSFAMSLTTYNVLEEPVFVGLQNYRNLFVNDEVFALALKNTVIFALITGVGGFALSFFVALAINELSKYLRAFLSFIFYVPTISDTVYTIWSVFFSGDIYGYANSFLMKLNLISDPIEWFTTDA